MITNSNQDIRTDYQAQDVFVPDAANQLTRAISYDFVITQDILEKYLDKHPTITEIDVGDLIACDSEGNDGSWSEPVKAPVSICIQGKTSISDAYCFNFGGRLLTDIVDCSDYQVDGSWDSTITVDMVNVYSTYPYRLKELVAGINFWSVPEKVASIVGAYASNAGVTRIGAFITEGATPDMYNLGESDFLQIVCCCRIRGYDFSISPTTAHIETGYRAAVVYADWMYGTNSATSGYYLPKNVAEFPGLYQQLVESIQYRTEPILYIRDSITSLSRYTLDYQDANEMRFSNASDGMSVTVSYLGALSWKQLTSAGGGRAVIADFDTSDVIPYVAPGNIPHKYIVGDENNIDSLTVYRPNSGFVTPQQDMNHYMAPTWYDAFPGFSFDKGNVTVLDWYFWYAISDFEDTDTTALVWRKNSRLDLHVDIGSLKAGIVYEINCHVVSLPSGPLSSYGNPEYPDYSVGSNPPLIYGKQASPVSSYADSDALDCNTLNLKPTITFDPFTGGSPVQVSLWGLPDRLLTNNKIYPAFYPAPEPNFGAKNIVDAAIQLKDLARAKVLFTYLDGQIYIMSY